MGPASLQYLSSWVNKPSIEITLESEEGRNNASIHTSATLDKIEGTVSIRCPHDTRFENVEITFVGAVRTYVEKMTATATMNGRSEAQHQFLKLTQPIPETSYPTPRIARAGQTYRFPFTFVVPPRLLPSACKHKVEVPRIQEEHLHLPPSLGDPDIAGKGNTLLDDLVPEMVKICYAVHVRLIRNRERDGKDVVIVDKSKKVRIVPAVEEAPPLSIDIGEEHYRLRHEKSIKKGLLKGKLGCLVMETSQPKSLHLLHPNSIASASNVTTMATVMLRFDPSSSSAPPPRLENLTVKLKATTFYACKPRKSIPSKSCTIYDPDQGMHVETLQLSSRCMESAQWEQHSGTALAPHHLRRDSGLSMLCLAEVPEASKDYQGKQYYSARLLVPITLPKNKAFVPTFHSCLVSRIYTLALSLSVHGPGIGGPTMCVKVPVQISSEVCPAASENTPSSVEQAEVEEFFEPRSVAPPSAEYVGRSSIGGWGRGGGGGVGTTLPPEYSYFGSRRGVVNVCG